MKTVSHFAESATKKNILKNNAEFKMITFTLPKSVSLNTLLRQHWSKRSREQKQMNDTVFALAWAAGWRREQCRRVKIIFLGSRMDYDNAIGGSKPILDALWRNDIIPGDSPKQIGLEYAFEDEGEGVRIELEVVK